MSPLESAAVFLIRTLFDIYLTLLLLRLILQMQHISFINPLMQFLHKATYPVIRPLRAILPTTKGWDWACFAAMLLLSFLKVALLSHLYKVQPALEGLALWAAGDLLTLTLTTYFYALLAFVILSWVGKGSSHPFAYIIQSLIQPILRPFQRLIPSVGGMDISPIPAMLFLQVLMILTAQPLTNAGMQLLA